MKSSRIVLALMFLFVTGCGKDGFLYYHSPSKQISIQPKVKEILGTTQVDIIWQVGGMSELESGLLQGADSFIKLMSQQTTLDWRIGVISTDPNEDQFLGFSPSSVFDSHSPNPVPTFDRAVKRVIESYDGEEMMDPVTQILSRYPNFIRPSAHLVIIATNDNHDASSQSVTSFLNTLKVLKGDLSKVNIYGVFGSIDLGCSSDQIDEDWNYAGSTYESVVTATHGSRYSLCTDDFGTSLGNIGSSIVDLASHTRIFLGSRPVTSSIVVSYHGTPLPPGDAGNNGVWTYDYTLNAIVFSSLSFAVNNDDSVDITYTEDNGQN
jgi:hypothetical protein